VKKKNKNVTPENSGRIIEMPPKSSRFMTKEELANYTLSRSEENDYGGSDKRGNVILSKNVRIAIDTKKSRRNLNILVLGSNEEHTIKPFTACLSLANENYVVQDKENTLYNAYAGSLEKAGYNVKKITADNLGRFDYDEFTDYGTLNKALFVECNDGRDKAEAAGFFSHAFARTSGDGKAGDSISITQQKKRHTIFLFPYFNELYRIPYLVEMLSMSRLADVSVMVRENCINDMASVYKGDARSLTANCDERILYHTEDKGTSDWISDDTFGVMSGTSIPEDKCIVKIRGYYPYLDDILTGDEFTAVEEMKNGTY
jgi:hypothetical protein